MRFAIIIAALALIAGCDAEAAKIGPKPSALTPLGAHFDVAQSGTLQGVVRWQGPQADVEPYVLYAGEATRAPNPNVPAVDADTRGIAGAVLLLRGVSPEKSRPWPHEPVSVTMCKREITVRQGDKVTTRALVRRGAALAMVNEGPLFHSLRGQGADSFSLPFQTFQLPEERRLDRAGVVELLSGAGYYWNRAYLFISETPYMAVSDAVGAFSLAEVPVGNYELACWLPDWHEERIDRDPETRLITRVYFKSPQEQLCHVSVSAGATTEAAFVWNLAHFAK